MPPAYLRGPDVAPPQRISGCTGKAIYDSRPRAAKAADRAQALERHKIKASPYPCDHCRGWHLSTRGKVRPA